MGCANGKPSGVSSPPHPPSKKTNARPQALNAGNSAPSTTVEPKPWQSPGTNSLKQQAVPLPLPASDPPSAPTQFQASSTPQSQMSPNIKPMPPSSPLSQNIPQLNSPAPSESFATQALPANELPKTTESDFLAQNAPSNLPSQKLVSQSDYIPQPPSQSHHSPHPPPNSNFSNHSTSPLHPNSNFQPTANPPQSIPSNQYPSAPLNNAQSQPLQPTLGESPATFAPSPLQRQKSAGQAKLQSQTPQPPTLVSQKSLKQEEAASHGYGSLYESTPNFSPSGQRAPTITNAHPPSSQSYTVDVPAGAYKLRYACLTQRGYYPEAPHKPNQDSFAVCPQFGGDPNDHLFGVYDGHGENGTPCSQFCRDRVSENLLRHRFFRSDVPQAFHGAFVSANVQLHRTPIDDTMSGTTGIVVLVRNRTLYAANVGDSRAVLAERRGKQLVAVDLSNDQTPFRPDECARVRACGARVLTLDQLEGLKNPHVQCWGGEDDDDGDPPRLWVPNGMYPGTAFTRSLGDTVAERIGVTAVPEVLVMQLTENHPFFVVASDGVFEFLSSQAVVDMVSQYEDPHDACVAVVAESYRLWLQYETRTDDITIIIVKIEGLTGGTALTPEVGNLANGAAWPVLRHIAQVHRKAIEGCGMDAGDADLAPSVRSDLPAKSAHELTKIEAALRSNFLFFHLGEQQRRLIFNSMEKMTVIPGDVIIRQGEIGDKFYVCDDGEFQVLVSSDQDVVPSNSSNLGGVVHKYSSKSNPCFGDLALLYGCKRESSVRAVSDGSLWVLNRSSFRAVQRSRSPRMPYLRLLRAVSIFTPLSLCQLQRLATSDCLQEIVLHNGEILVHSDKDLDTMYIVERGEIEIKQQDGLQSLPGVANGFGLPGPPSPGAPMRNQLGPQCIGEWVLQGRRGPRINVSARGNLRCIAVPRDKFESIVGPLPGQAAEDQRLRRMQAQLQEELRKDSIARLLGSAKASDLEWEETVYVTDCCELGRVTMRSNPRAACSMKRYVKERVQKLGRSLQVLREKTLLQEIAPSPFVPPLLGSCSDASTVGLLVDARLSCPLSMLLNEPFSEPSVRYLSASVVLALQLLHKEDILCRSVAPDLLLLDEAGHLQMADLRFAKRLIEGRTFTLCGVPDYLSPEAINGLAYGQAADWWALGVLIFTMLAGECPFGSWKDNELQVYMRITQRNFHFPRHFSPDVIDLLDKLLVLKPEDRLGCGVGGVEGIKQHPWFATTRWDDLLALRAAVPYEIQQRLAVARRQLTVMDKSLPRLDPSDLAQADPDDPGWFEGW